jgi:hypothetical protein
MALSIHVTEPDVEIIEPRVALDTLYGCDLHAAFSQALDAALEGAAPRGMPVKVDLDPRLHALRLVDSERAKRALQAAVAAASLLAARGRGGMSVSISAPVETVVSADVSVGYAPDRTLNQPPVREAVMLAHALDASLAAHVAEDRLTLTLTLPAPLARPRWLMVTDDEALGREFRSFAEPLAAVDVNRPSDCERLWRRPFAAVMVDLFSDEIDVFAAPKWSAAPVFAVTDSDTTAGRWALRKAGFAGVLARPFAVQALSGLPLNA